MVFGDQQAADAALAQYDGRCGPAAKAFQPAVSAVVRPGGLGWQPSLQSQLEPLTLAQLRDRVQLLDASGFATLDQLVDRGIAENGVVAGKALLVDHLCAVHTAQPRRCRYARGVSIDAALCDTLLTTLRAANWGEKERRVIAEQYLTIRQPWAGASRKAHTRCKQGMQKHSAIWEAAARVIESAGPAQFKYTSLAVTANFQGSPHRDLLDQSYQFAVSLGEFGQAGGGRLCVESGADKITCIETHKRLACIDGRFTHWVDGYDGERFSVIYYSVDESHFTEPISALPLPEFANLCSSDKFGEWYRNRCCV